MVVCCAAIALALAPGGAAAAIQATRPRMPAPLQALPGQLEPRDSLLAAIAARAIASERVVSLALGLVDSIGARLSGTPAGARAETWALAQLSDVGLDSVWAEPVPLRVWERGPADITVASASALAGRRIRVAAYGYSPPAHRLNVPLVDLGRGDPAALRRVRQSASGSILLCDVVVEELVQEAAAAGAVALLRVSMEPGTLIQGRMAPAARPPAPLPVLATTLEDGLWLRRQLAYGEVRLDVNVQTSLRDGEARNIIGEWRGRAAPDEVVLLGAHLDSWDLGAGALDNASGVLTALEAVRSVVESGRRPRRSIRVVLFAAEELGLVGSRAYVARHAPSLARIVAMFNFDMVGRPDGYGATGHAEGDTLLAGLTRHPSLESLALSPEVDHGGGAGSDHQPFVLAGVPALYVRTSLAPETLRWYHNAGDTLDKMDLDGVRRAAAAAAVAAWAIADAPGRVFRHLGEKETRELVRRLRW
ncbi:MAG: Zn-dependent exopeptidase M28 [Gemmatimonadetes bacterium]|nr:Zn-dependent exopeptidase M28 [Gemmatimonadota bacterium]